MEIVNAKAPNDFNRLLEQEESLVFDSFSRADALAVGLKMVELAKGQNVAGSSDT